MTRIECSYVSKPETPGKAPKKKKDGAGRTLKQIEEETA